MIHKSQDLITLRKQIKTKLQNLTPEFYSDTSQKITTKIITSKIFKQGQNIAAYNPIENEVDVWLIIKTIWKQGKNCYLPAFDPTTKNYLKFIKFEPGDELINIKHKVFEPKVSSKTKMIMPQDLDLVIVPLLGFNKNKFRLGRGGGCYDRTFSFKLHNPDAKPHLLGVGYKWQRIDFVPKSWDIKMDGIVVI